MGGAETFNQGSSLASIEDRKRFPEMFRGDLKG